MKGHVQYGDFAGNVETTVAGLTWVLALFGWVQYFTAAVIRSLRFMDNTLTIEKLNQEFEFKFIMVQHG